MLKKTGLQQRIKIAYDEWNLRGWHHPGLSHREGGQDIQAREKNDINATYTMADALFSACFLNACIRNSKYVVMACMAPVVNARGPLFVYPGGIVKRTTYHVLNLYANKLQPGFLPVKLISDSLYHKEKSVPAVDAILTTSFNKKHLAFVLVNKHPEKEAECDLGIRNTGKIGKAILLSGDSTDAFNDIDAPERVVPIIKSVEITNGNVVIPPHTLMILDVSMM